MVMSCRTITGWKITITEDVMHYGEDRVYKKIEVIGVSKVGIEDAIKVAIAKAHKTLERVSWFEVKEIHGHVGEEGQVTEYQVILKVSFELK